MSQSYSWHALMNAMSRLCKASKDVADRNESRLFWFQIHFPGDGSSKPNLAVNSALQWVAGLERWDGHDSFSE